MYDARRAAANAACRRSARSATVAIPNLIARSTWWGSLLGNNNMNVEENRLQTFADWPADAQVQPSRIAKAGFFYTRRDITVECFACHLKIWEWSYGDQVMAKHQQLSPDCPFVKDPSTSGNVPNISTPTTATTPTTTTSRITSTTSSSSSSSTPAMREPSDEALVDEVMRLATMEPSDEALVNEVVRLATFVDWPVAFVTPAALARAGFYSLRQGDLTKCAFCCGVVGAWEPGDDPDREHSRHFPHCTFVRGTIHARLEESGSRGGEGGGGAMRDLANRSAGNLPNINLVRDGNLAALGVNAHKGPRKPKYGTLEARLVSFANWPDDLVQTPDTLAHAGFYYEGCGDQVRCFHCDGGLKHWDPHDEPWTEHARWFPQCGFVALLKGQDFITACAPELDDASVKELQSSNTTTAATNHQRRKTAHPTQRARIPERVLEAYMMTAVSRAALDVGLQVDRVRQAIREKVERTGVGFSTGDALIEATLNLQRDDGEDDADNDVEDSSISRSVTNMLNDVILSMHEPARLSAAAAAVASAATPGEAVAGAMVSLKQPPRTTTPAAVVQPVCSSKPTTSVSTKAHLSLEEENRLLKEARLCKICMDSEVGIVFLPCGHLATCVNCAPNLQDCPVCRCAIKATVRTFLS